MPSNRHRQTSIQRPKRTKYDVTMNQVNNFCFFSLLLLSSSPSSSGAFCMSVVVRCRNAEKWWVFWYLVCISWNRIKFWCFSPVTKVATAAAAKTTKIYNQTPSNTRAVFSLLPLVSFVFYSDEYEQLQRNDLCTNRNKCANVLCGKHSNVQCSHGSGQLKRQWLL